MGGGSLEGKGDDGRSHGTDGKIDVEAPRVEMSSGPINTGGVERKNESRDLQEQK